jgi:MFS family permease
MLLLTWVFVLGLYFSYDNPSVIGEAIGQALGISESK